MAGRRALTDEQIKWAYDRWYYDWRSWEEIARALFVTTQTLKNSVYAIYGHPKKRRQRAPLVYKEER